MFPPGQATFPRVCIEDHILGEKPENQLLIKKDMIVRGSFISVHFNPKYYTEPEKFIPERFLDNTI
jgi:cytochrome P450